MHCMNCSKTLEPQQGHLYLEVFVCEECKQKAEILRKGARSELRRLLTLLDETVRIALTEGRLTFSDKQDLETVLRLREENDKSRSRQ